VRWVCIGKGKLVYGLKSWEGLLLNTLRRPAHPPRGGHSLVGQPGWPSLSNARGSAGFHHSFGTSGSTLTFPCSPTASPLASIHFSAPPTPNEPAGQELTNRQHRAVGPPPHRSHDGTQPPPRVHDRALDQHLGALGHGLDVRDVQRPRHAHERPVPRGGDGGEGAGRARVEDRAGAAAVEAGWVLMGNGGGGGR
jgi:hypothetical protein